MTEPPVVFSSSVLPQGFRELLSSRHVDKKRARYTVQEKVVIWLWNGGGGCLI